jgi:hypothetical protein
MDLPTSKSVPWTHATIGTCKGNWWTNEGRRKREEGRGERRGQKSIHSPPRSKERLGRERRERGERGEVEERERGEDKNPYGVLLLVPRKGLYEFLEFFGSISPQVDAGIGEKPIAFSEYYGVIAEPLSENFPEIRKICRWKNITIYK